MVLAAGQYVGASDDLRPRVLEAARLQGDEQSAQRRLRHVALVVVLLALLTPELRQGFSERQMGLSGGIQEINLGVLNSLTPASITRSGDGDWRMIDAFTKLRQQQAQLLRLEI
jgi:hypothetical protein